MPKTRVQETIFTIMMVLIMVYGMICYNASIAMEGMSNKVFIAALKELPIMACVAFLLDTFIVGPIAKKKTFKIFNPKETKGIVIILSISVFSICIMCPLMSLVATIFIKGMVNSEVISVWLQTTVLNFPMAFFLQLFAVGPLVRFIFGKIFKENN